MSVCVSVYVCEYVCMCVSMLDVKTYSSPVTNLFMTCFHVQT